MSYWDETDRYVRQNGNPRCPGCGAEMFPEDDHGRFTCVCGRGLDVVTGMEPPVRPLPQVDTTGMTEDQINQIAPIYRLNSPMTAADRKAFNDLARLHGQRLPFPEDVEEK